MSHLALVARDHSRLLAEQPYVIQHTLAREGGPVSDLATVVAHVFNARRHYREPISRQEPSVPERFRSLLQRWREDTAVLSSISQIAMDPSYQQIIGLGPAAVPLILRELEHAPGHWFWALKSITGVDPVAPDQRGRIPQMAAAWLAWAKEQGLSW